MDKQISHPSHPPTKGSSIFTTMPVVFLGEIFDLVTLATLSALNHAIQISFYLHIHRAGSELFSQIENLNLERKNQMEF